MWNCRNINFDPKFVSLLIPSQNYLLQPIKRSADSSKPLKNCNKKNQAAENMAD